MIFYVELFILAMPKTRKSQQFSRLHPNRPKSNRPKSIRPKTNQPKKSPFDRKKVHLAEKFQKFTLCRRNLCWVFPAHFCTLSRRFQPHWKKSKIMTTRGATLQNVYNSFTFPLITHNNIDPSPSKPVYAFLGVFVPHVCGEPHGHIYNSSFH